MFLPGLSPNVPNVNWNNFIDVYSGQLISAMERNTVTDMFPVARRQVFPMGARADQFMVTGRRTGKYRARGASIMVDTQTSPGTGFLDTLPSTPVYVYMDRPYNLSFFLDANDEYQSQWPEVEAHVEAAGEDAARRRDTIALLLMARGAYRRDGLSGANKTYLSGQKVGITSGTSNASTYWEPGATPSGTTPANWGSNAADTEKLIVRMSEAFKRSHYPSTKRKAMFVLPGFKEFIATELSEYVTYDTTPGNGSLASGELMKILGWEVYETTNMPSGTYTVPLDISGAGSSGTSNDYRHDCTGLAALFCGEDAIGIETMGPTGLTLESKYDFERGGRAYKIEWTGGGVELRPEFLGAIATTADSGGQLNDRNSA